MTAIADKELVYAPLASAGTLLEAFFAAHAVPDGGSRVVLRAGEMAQPAIVTQQPAHRPADMTPRFRVHWEAEAGGPYPMYDGELTIGADEDYNAFWLVLDGAYAPPSGIAGGVFDAVAGRRIAVTSARGLLVQMRTEIEARFSAQERAKPA